MWLTDHGDFFRRGVWEPLLMLGAGEACLLAATESSWAFLLLEYRKAIDFHVLTLHPATLL